jgi:hypothetical protein
MLRKADPLPRFAGEMLGFALSAVEGQQCSCSGDRGAPGEEGADHKVAFAEMVGDLEFHVHQAGVVTGEDARAVTERAGVVLSAGRGAGRCAGTPGGDLIGREPPGGGVLCQQPAGGVQAGGGR